MKRRHFFEIADQPWCPAWLRDFAVDYLEQVITVSKVYEPVIEPLQRAVKFTQAENVIDLCSGGGPWRQIGPAFAAHCPAVKIVLTDLQPNAGAQARQLANSALQIYPVAVNALQVPSELTGFRTLFSAFHHFKPDEARVILRDAVASRSGIFEGTQRHPKALLGMLFVPLVVWLVTPHIRPFRWSRLLWTYLLPVVSFVVLLASFHACAPTRWGN